LIVDLFFKFNFNFGPLIVAISFLFKLNGPYDQFSEPVHEVHSRLHLLIQPKTEVTFSP